MEPQKSTRYMMQWVFVSAMGLLFVYSILWSQTGLFVLIPLRTRVATIRQSNEQTQRINKVLQARLKQVRSHNFSQKIGRQVLQLIAPSETLYTESQ